MKGPADGRNAADTGTGNARDATEQSRLFEEAVELLQAQRYAEAKRYFELAALGPVAEVAHAARQRARMCERRMATQPPVLASAEDHYNYAVLLLNQRRWAEAEAHLNEALAQDPNGDHVYYALALCRCWSGDLEGASRYMRQAIELAPANRIAARNDPDFAPFANQPPLADLLKPEPAGPGQNK